ncbi:MAG TPA: ORF6N domain-containing protein [bacterium]
MKNEIAVDKVAKKILLFRGLKVMLDSDLAELYGVKTKELNKAVRRNKTRFPVDFMFRLTSKEVQNLRFQIGTSSFHGGRRYLSYVFTQEGVAMLSSVLRSQRAVRVNIQIMRAFVRLRELLTVHKDLARRLEALEKKFDTHDAQIKLVFETIRDLMRQPEKPKGRIGFV